MVRSVFFLACIGSALFFLESKATCSLRSADSESIATKIDKITAKLISQISITLRSFPPIVVPSPNLTAQISTTLRSFPPIVVPSPNLTENLKPIDIESEVIAFDCVQQAAGMLIDCQAAGMLIDCLIEKGDLFNAGRIAQQTYENLTDQEIDQEGEEVASGSYNLANVIYLQKGDLLKAEFLAREALRIRSLVYFSDDYAMGANCDLLARILQSQGKFEDETQGLFERSLAIFIMIEGPDGSNTAVVSMNIDRYYHELAELEPLVDDIAYYPYV